MLPLSLFDDRNLAEIDHDDYPGEWRNPAYLNIAQIRYAAVRQYFLEPASPLYTVYVP